MRAYRKLVLHRRVVVNLIGGSAMDGVLWDERGALVVLRDVRMLVQGGGASPVDGEVVIERSRIDFVQVPS